MTDTAAVPDLAPLHAWFVSYCESFRSADADLQRNYDLKELHTRNVCAAARRIAQGESPRRLMLVEVAALCHDLGRFPQFRDFGTFKDSESLNHAHLSAQILEQNGLLGFLPESERNSVLAAVRLHNVYQVPAGLPAESEELLRLLRDADKIDIWRVFLEYFQTPEHERPSGATLGYPDIPGYSPEVLAALDAGKMVQLSSMKSVNDFKLLQLSWIYDINCRNSFRLVQEVGVLERYAALLPAEETIQAIVARLHGYLEQNLAGG